MILRFRAGFRHGADAIPTSEKILARIERRYLFLFHALDEFFPREAPAVRAPYSATAPGTFGPLQLSSLTDTVAPINKTRPHDAMNVARPLTTTKGRLSKWLNVSYV
jgi:hypothetical protein